MFVCVCSAVTDSEIKDAIDDGVTNFEAMQDRLDVATSCGACACEVKTILQQKLNAALASRGSVMSAKEINLSV